MTILEIIKAPDPRLKLVAKPVTKVDDALRAFLDDLLETMYASRGIGLAATQVGDLRRVLVMDVEQKEENGEQKRGKPLYLINPEIVELSDEMNVYQEGCLSFPEQFADVERPKMARIRYLDYHGKEQEIMADDLLATCVQHEIDHLDGKVFVDHISKLKRDMIIRRLQKMKKFAG
jgi:peptide deformylase